MLANISKARKLGKPIYEITSRGVNGLTLFIARDINERGEQKGIYPVARLNEVGRVKILEVDVGSAGIVSYNINDIDRLINEVENLPVGSYTNLDPHDPKDFINGFMIAYSSTGKRRDYKFEFPVLFYQVEVNEKLNFLEYDRLKKQVDAINHNFDFVKK